VRLGRSAGSRRGVARLRRHRHGALQPMLPAVALSGAHCRGGDFSRSWRWRNLAGRSRRGPPLPSARECRREETAGAGGVTGGSVSAPELRASCLRHRRSVRLAF
jgi:hypothetical protein